MSILNNTKEGLKESEHYKKIKKSLKDKNLNPKKLEDLKDLLSLTLRDEFNFDDLLIFLLKYITQKNEKIFYEYFFQSLELDKLNIIKILIDNGLNVNCQNDLGETPLHIAISKNNIELIKLLIKYEPKTNLLTYKDGLTATNYAKILGNKKIIKIIEDLNEKNKKKLIKSEIIDYINKDMNNLKSINIEDLNSFTNINNNFDEIQNYNGEIISILSNEEKSNSIINKNVNKKIMLNNKNKNCNINNITSKILNESELCEYISPKNTIKVNNFSNNINNINNNISNYNGILNDENHQISEECNQDTKITKNISKKQIKSNYSSPIKKDELINSYNNNKNNNPSYVHYLTTLDTVNKGQFGLPLKLNKTYKLKDKQMELSKFMININLPKIYAKYLLDNGFDDLEVLIRQSKNGIALSNQHLKGIGINSAGDRAKILIHLEELADNFPFLIEKEIIYSNKIEENNNSLYKFFASIFLEDHFKIFCQKGYYNAELLYTQMASKHPINEDILRKEFGINKIGLINRIMVNLSICSENYIKRLIQKNSEHYKSIVYDGNPHVKSYDGCLII